MEAREMRVESGATVQATDGRVGVVDEVITRPETGELAYLVIRRAWHGEQVTIPASLIKTIPSQREVRLSVSREKVLEHSRAVRAEDVALGKELHIPLVEERLIADKQDVDLGELRVRKRVESSEEVVRQPISRDDVEVVHQAVGEFIEKPAATREEGEWLIVPVMEEVLVVEKRLMLKEEIRIRRRQITEEQEVRETVRRERLELEDATATGVRGLDPSLTRPHETTQAEGEAT